MATVQELAARYLQLAEKRTRDNGEKFWVFNDKDENLSQLIQDAHGDMMPDDWRYAFIVDALREIEEATDEWLEEPEHDYTQDLSSYQATLWLGSHGDRSSYVDDYVSEYGVDTKNFSVMNLIICGYAAEKEEVFYSVLSSLRNLADDEDESDDEDEDFGDA